MSYTLVHKNKTRLWFFIQTFLSLHPAKKKCCLDSSGLNLTQYGIFLFVNRAMHWPVSISQYLINLSYEHDKNFFPSLLISVWRTPLLCPSNVRSNRRLPYVSHNFIFESIEVVSNKCPLFG